MLAVQLHCHLWHAPTGLALGAMHAAFLGSACTIHGASFSTLAAWQAARRANGLMCSAPAVLVYPAALQAILARLPSRACA